MQFININDAHSHAYSHCSRDSNANTDIHSDTNTDAYVDTHTDSHRDTSERHHKFDCKEHSIQHEYNHRACRRIRDCELRQPG